MKPARHRAIMSVLFGLLVLAWVVVVWGVIIMSFMHDAHAQTRATRYADRFENRVMANGQRFHQRGSWCASRHHHPGARLRLTNGARVAYCTVGDWPGRDVLDLPRAVFVRLAPVRQGVITGLRVEEVAEGR